MPPMRGSGFVGLQQYLDANRESAARMGQGLVDQVEQEGGAARGAVDAAVTDAEGKIAAGTPTFNPQATYGLEPDEVAAARPGLEGAQYTGPSGLEGGDDLATKTFSAQQTAELAGTDAGRAVLLAKGRKGPVSQGGGMLDAFLAGRGGGAALDRTVGSYSKLRDYLGTAQKGVATKVEGAKTAAEEVRKKNAVLLGSASTYAPPSNPNTYTHPGQLQPPKAPHPYVDSAKKIEDDNRTKYRAGARG